MWWILFALINQAVSAVVIVLDKYLLSDKTLKSPVVYGFLSASIASFAFILIPFINLTLPSGYVLWLSFLMGILQTGGIIAMYTAIKTSSVAEAMPVIGAITALSTLAFQNLLIDGTLPHLFFFGFVLLVAGSFLMSKFEFGRATILYMLLAGTGFGLSSVVFKLITFHLDFIDSFFWTRIVQGVSAFALLLVPGVLHTLVSHREPAASGTVGFAVIADKILASVALVFYLLALDLGNPALVNAFSGLQYAFLFLFALWCAKTFPAYFKEEYHEKEKSQKFAAIIIIMIGMALLFI